MKPKAKGCVSFLLTENARAGLCLVISIVNWVCIVVSLLLLSLGTYIKLSLQQFTNLVTDYDGDSLPYLLISLGLLSALSNGFGGWLAFASADPDRRLFLRFFHFGYVIETLCVCVAIFAGAIMCFAHIQHLHDSFHGGLTAAMIKYREDHTFKQEMDLLQMEYSCCGNDGYTDWFQVSWIHEDYLNIQSAAQMK